MPDDDAERAVDLLPSVERGYVTLPYTEEQFKGFLKSLLGSPQAITKRIPGSFQIVMQDVINLHHLLVQRVEQQNAGVLASLTANIVYSDNSTVELGSYEAITTYNQIRDVFTVAVHLTWDFVITFPAKGTPEKQRVQVSFMTRGLFELEDEVTLPFHIAFPGTASIAFRIEHTERTWGADLESILTDHFAGLIQAGNQVREFVRNHSTRVVTLPSFVVFMAAAIVGTVAASARYAAALVPTHDLSTEARIVNIEGAILGGAWSQFNLRAAIFLIIAAFVGTFFAVVLESVAISRNPSFILLSSRDRAEQTRVGKKNRQRFGWYITTIAANIVVGVVANLLFVSLFGDAGALRP